MMKTMGINAQLNKKVTNHSLRSYGTTEMFQNGVPEKTALTGYWHTFRCEVCALYVDRSTHFALIRPRIVQQIITEFRGYVDLCHQHVNT